MISPHRVGRGLWDKKWNERYRELRGYVAEHGNSLVPHDYPKNKPLGFWIYNQRHHYFNNSIIGDNDASMTPSDERVRKLDELGFVWDVREAQWLERYEELKVYVAEHGDSLVPGNYSKITTSTGAWVVDDARCEEENRGVTPKNPILGRWVNNQRVAYKIYKRKREFDNTWGGIEALDDDVKEEMGRLTRMPSDMTQERIRLLEEVGFVWDVHAHVWESRYRELRDFLARHGHTDVRARARGGGAANDPLAHWVSTQRNYYVKHQKGQHTSLTEKRIGMLDSIGFAWKVPRSKKKSQSRAKTAGAQNS